MISDRKKDDDCIFCKVISGEIKTRTVYEDEYSYAFLDIEPIREGHTLVIPKNHHVDAEDMPDDEYSHMMLTVKKFKNLYKDLFNVPKVGFFISGWDVNHAHVHVVPMKDSKDITSKPLLDKTAPKFTDKEFEKTIEKITQALSNR